MHTLSARASSRQRFTSSRSARTPSQAAASAGAAPDGVAAAGHCAWEGQIGSDGCFEDIDVYTHAHTHSHTHIHSHIHSLTHIHTHIPTRKHTHTHTHTHLRIVIFEPLPIIRLNICNIMAPIQPPPVFY